MKRELSGIGMTSQRTRSRMIERLRADGIRDERVLAAMAAVPRHIFVEEALASRAYEDTALPIGLKQTISQPFVVARMIELLAAWRELGKTLEIGAGCGYQAAVLAQLAKDVYAVERIAQLHDKARANLRPLRLATVHLILGDGMAGFARGAPYAGIVAAAGGEAVPEAWIDQLAWGGRIVAPVATAAGQQALIVIDKSRQGVQQTVLEAVNFVPLKSGIA